MKKIALLALALGINGIVLAQTMKIHCGAVTVAVPAAEAGRMVYGGAGTTLNVMGKNYAIADIDSITVDRSVVAPNSVAVRYAGDKAHVLIAGNIAPKMSVTAEGADVAVVAAPDLLQEVYYTLKGQSDDGSFFMDGEYKAAVTLDNLTLNNKNGAAIDIANGKRIDVIVPDGTLTRLSDGAGMQKACFFVNGHPEFTGGGTLELIGNVKHAFASDEYTRMKSKFGTLKVLKAEGDGMHIQQFFKMDGGRIEIAGTKGDGIDVSFTKTPTDSLNGQVYVNAGTIRMDVTAPDTKGLKVDSIGNLTISGGTIEANVIGDGCKGISVGGDILVEKKYQTPTLIKMLVSGTTYMPKDPNMESKCRGIRGKKNMTLDGGDIQISVTGVKAKAVKLDGSFYYKSGQYNCIIDAANM